MKQEQANIPAWRDNEMKSQSPEGTGKGQRRATEESPEERGQGQSCGCLGISLSQQYSLFIDKYLPEKS